jgi:predicted amidohydrolase YtcJ
VTSERHGSAQKRLGAAVPPDLILHNANVVTLDPTLPRARALAVKGERIVALGDDKTILGTAGPNTVAVDARGLTVLPGFNDNHLHTLGMGLFFQHPNLFGKNADEIVEALKQHYADRKPGQRLTGYAWDYSSCPHPNKALLDQVFPNNPVVLRQYSGHAQWLNTLALKELLDAAAKTSKVGTGAIVRDEQGEPTGIVLGTVVHSSHRRELLRRALTPSLHWGLLNAALDRFRKAGITSVQDNTWQPFTIWLLHLLRRLGRLTARFSCWSFGQFPLLARGMDLSLYNPLWIRRGPEKYIVDGAFSPHTAWMLAPYDGETGNTGRSVLQPQELETIVRRGAKRRRQLAFHTIGDGAAKAVLDAIETVSRDLPVVTRLRIRMEHVQIIDPADIERMRRLGVLASVQPVALALPERDRALVGPERFARLYPYRSLLDAGVNLSFGSDIPGEIEYDPFQVIYRAVSRRGVAPKGVAYDLSEALTVEQAVMAYCRGSAYAENMEEHKGALVPGMLADFIALSQDIFATDVERIPETKVLLTVVGGRVVHSLL